MHLGLPLFDQTGEKPERNYGQPKYIGEQGPREHSVLELRRPPQVPCISLQGSSIRGPPEIQGIGNRRYPVCRECRYQESSLPPLGLLHLANNLQLSTRGCTTLDDGPR